MLPSGLSMLWEGTEPHAALRERFGFGGQQDAAAWCASVLAERWGLTVHGCTRTVISDRNAILWVATDRGPAIVKWSAAGERFGRLEAATRLLRSLADRGVPVARPLPSRRDEDRLVLEGPAGPLSIAVLPQLPGDWLDVTDLAAVHAAGRALAHLHRALAVCAVDDALAEPRITGLPERVARRLEDAGPDPAPEATRRLGDLLARAPRLEERPQLVHHDFRAANVLVGDGAVTGILDLDEALVADPLHDLAQASVYLGTRFTDWRPTPAAAREALRAGYAAVRPLSPADDAWLELLVLWHGLLAIPGSHDPVAWARAV